MIAIMRGLKYAIKKILNKIFLFIFPEFKFVFVKEKYHDYEKYTRLYEPCVQGEEVLIGAYSYVASHSHISFTTIGKFCSIGPFFLCGWGIHPTNGISTSPIFYSTRKQNGITLAVKDKIIERKNIIIGNDVFIGANVTVLDGVTIGDGAVIGAGAVVSKNIPPYAIAVGCPIRIKSYRFDELTIKKLLEIKWWDFPDEKLYFVEKYFFDVKYFIKICEELSE
jgi:acetyltransferase-like isoleucine patch superfamily enzyme